MVLDRCNYLGVVVQLVGLELLPFSLAKQNLMLAVLDARVGLNNQAGVAFTKIANISEAWQWTAARGDMGIVNITLITMRDRPQVNVGEVHPLPMFLRKRYWSVVLP